MCLNIIVYCVRYFFQVFNSERQKQKAIKTKMFLCYFRCLSTHLLFSVLSTFQKMAKHMQKHLAISLRDKNKQKT